MAKWYDAAARWWFLKGGAGKTTFAPGATVKVGGKELECGHHLRALKKNLVGAEVVAADDAIKTRLAELRAEDPSGHDAPWPGLEVLQEVDANEKGVDAAARWWILARGGVGVTTFESNARVPVDNKPLNCGLKIRKLKELEGDDVVAADAAIRARLAVLRAAGTASHSVPWPGLGVLQEGV